MENHKFAFSDSIFDSRTGTLTRKNRDLHLPEQTARLLAVLLERANTLVTREELRTTLWPDEEFLDYDQGINTAINRLRNAIQDNSRSPQLIRTIPKRGYSFHGEVKRVSSGLAESSSFLPGPLHAVASEAPSLLAMTDRASATPSSAIEREPPNHSASSQILRSRRIGWRWVAIAAALVFVVASGWLVWHTQASRSRPHPLLLGIAPLLVHGDAQTTELSDNFRLDITDALSRLPGVEVHAASTFGDEKQPLLGLGSESRIGRIDQVLLGTIVQQGTNYDLKFELVRASDTIHLASFEYSGARQELPSIRDRLQQDLFYFLQSRTTTIQTTKGSTNDARAYDLYLQGSYRLFDRSPASLERALADFRQAIGSDPAFASAYAGMATAYLKLSAFDPSPETGNLRRAEDYARQALIIDPLLAQAHAVLGYSVFAHDWDFSQGERELRYAIRIDPTQADYRDWLSVLLVDQGRFDEGFQQLTVAQTDDPYWPSVYAMEGLMGVLARRSPEAIEAGKKYVALLPTLPIAHDTLAWVYFQSGRYQDAANEWKQMALLQNDPARVKLEEEGIRVLKTKGIRAYSLLRLEAIKRNRGTVQSNDFIPAEWYACAGKRDEAIAELSHMASTRNQYILGVAVNPLFDSIHSDPRFANLLKAVGLSLPDSVRNQNSRICETSS